MQVNQIPVSWHPSWVKNVDSPWVGGSDDRSRLVSKESTELAVESLASTDSTDPRSFPLLGQNR